MFEILSDIQKEVVFNKSGKFVVRACPGSGKTFCVSARLARLIKNWQTPYQGIAAVSFTNVAWKEIEKKYSEKFHFNKLISHPHFLGTIDSFTNKYIFLPFGHLVLKCPNRPILVGEPHGIWTGKYFSDGLFDNISYNIDGTYHAINERKMPTGWMSNVQILRSKANINKGGYATQSDANYFAMRVLEVFPQIAKSIALRFPYLIVDEAQDTSDIQMRIIDLLIANGLNEVMLVGDPDQAIFEWNDARPDLLLKKYGEWNNSVVLNENRRSSQLICNSTHKISSLAQSSISVDENIKDFPHKPKVIQYKGNLPEIVEQFLGECEANEIEITRDNVAIIYRSKSLINEITGVAEVPFDVNPWNTYDNYTKDFARGKFLYDKGELKTGFKTIEKALLKLIDNLSYCSEEYIGNAIDRVGFVNFKSDVFQFVRLLPKTDSSLGDWVDAANSVIKNAGLEKELSINSKARSFTFQQVFMSENESIVERRFRLGSVHSVKGETFQAVLLILKTKGVGKAYKTILSQNISTSESEELRIAYVGMTRPRKILVLAVPDEPNRIAWETKFASN